MFTYDKKKIKASTKTEKENLKNATTKALIKIELKPQYKKNSRQQQQKKNNPN